MFEGAGGRADHEAHRFGVKQLILKPLDCS